MTEIQAIPINGFTVVSTFSGCGGSCLGYRMAGFRVLWANEFIPAAQEVYRANHPESILNTQDIRTLAPSDILSAIKKRPGEIDILDGSPPCASFSTAGKRESGWGKVKQYSETVQRVDDLFFEYARLLEGLQPKVFVAENVSGLVKGVAKGYFLEILSALKACGYNVKAKLLDAQWLGVPQMRQRIIFVGVRNDLGLEPAFPKPLPYRYSVRDALPNLLAWQEDCGFNGHRMRTAEIPIGTITQSGRGNLVEAYRDNRGAFGTGTPCIVPTECSMEGYAVGAEWDTLRLGEASGKYRNLVRPSLDKPCPTITQIGGHKTVASVTHPTEKRKFTIAELKRVSAFPDDFVLTGTYAQQWERLGRAVPPVMMAAIATTIRDEILCKLPK